MHSQKPRSIKYKNGKTVIETNNEQEHHVKMMLEDSRLRWGFKYLTLILCWLSRKEFVKIIEYAKAMFD